MEESWRSEHLSEVMTGNVIRVLTDNTLLHAQFLITESKLTRLVVTDDSSRLRGIITRRDIVRFLSRDKTGRPLDAIKVKECMSTPVIDLQPTDTLVEGARVMTRKGISSIVVTDGHSQILGIVTKTDLCYHYAQSKSRTKVKEYMAHKVFTVRPTHSIFFVASLLAQQGISRVPVVDDRLLGIITLSDIISKAPLMRPDVMEGRKREAIHTLAKLTSMTAVSVMTSKPLTVTPEEPLSKAAKLMIDHGISGLPVTDRKGNLRSIITKTDIIRAMAAD